MRFALLALVGCASTPAPPPPVEQPAPKVETRAELAAAQNARLDEQATALASSCEATEPAKPRCLPSCYTPESIDPRVGKLVRGGVEITHRVCKREEGVYRILDEGVALSVRRSSGVAKPHRKGTWQAEVEAAVRASLEPELARADVVVALGTWKPVTHPITQEALKCVEVSHYTRNQRRKLDHCGGQGEIACEAGRSDAAHGLNVVRYRLSEARRLRADHEDEACRDAALEAVAVARGMPRWRQYMTLNTTKWKASKRYRTRFDGILDEDTLFATAITLGVEAEKVYADCGGAWPKTTAAQEQSFHTCW